MNEIMYEAGFLLSYTLDKLDNYKFVNPIYAVILEDGSKEFKEIKELSLEYSIPKAVSMYEENSINAKSATIIFPAELLDDNSNRYSVLIINIQKYNSLDYITIALPYSFVNGFLQFTNYELLDYFELLEDDLTNLEKSFIQGAYSYDNAENIWENKFTL